MDDVCIKLIHNYSKKVYYKIVLTAKITLVCDDSGTGKTAFRNIVLRQNEDTYVLDLTGADDIVVLINEASLYYLDSHVTDNIVVVMDEEDTDAYLTRIVSLIEKSNWHVLVITRDSSALSKIHGVRMRFVLDSGSTIVNVEDTNFAEFSNGEFNNINQLYVEDSTSGLELYTAITQGKVTINDGCMNRGGVNYIADVVQSKVLTDKTVIVFDQPSFLQVSNEFFAYIQESYNRVCIYVSVCTEWLLLHSDMFFEDSDVVSFLQWTESPIQGKTLEQFAYDLIKSKDIDYDKAHNKLHWRLLTPSSIHAIGKQLPTPFQSYIQNYTLNGNRHCNLGTLVHSIMSQYKAEIAACHPNCEWDKFIWDLVKQNEDITTPDGVLKYINNTAQQTTLFTTPARTIQEIMRVPSIIYKAIDAGATFPTLEEFLTNKLGKTTSLTDSEIIALLSKTEQTT